MVGGADGELLRCLVRKQAKRACRQPKTCSGGSAAPKHETAAESAVRNSRRLFPDRLLNLAGGEDKGYFALDEGGRRFESCRGLWSRVAQWLEHLNVPLSLVPRQRYFVTGSLAARSVESERST